MPILGEEVVVSGGKKGKHTYGFPSIRLLNPLISLPVSRESRVDAKFDRGKVAMGFASNATRSRNVARQSQLHAITVPRARWKLP
ncbi:MAG: hypothetical protein LBB18_00590 [Puniceicoccales bacterium]|nr:hypothetical protein [Puniceicoccales bacterium]